MVVLPRARINTAVHLARCPRTVGNGRNDIKVVAVERGQGGKVISVADPFRNRLAAASHQVLSVAGVRLNGFLTGVKTIEPSGGPFIGPEFFVSVGENLGTDILGLAGPSQRGQG